MPQQDGASTNKVALQLAQKWRLDKHLDTDPTLAGKHDGKVPSQKAVKAYVDSREAFPVGAVFIGVVATNPATLLGYGTWAAFGAGRVLVGRDAGDADFDTVEETGGAKTKAISAHAGSAVADHADHNHHFTPNVTGTTNTFNGTGAAAAVVSLNNNTSTTAGSNATLGHNVTQPNNHTDLNVVQPYIVVYMWKRTA